jgi:hypothetical protein
MLPAEEIQALTYAIDRLTAELRQPLPDDRRLSISETLEVLRKMRAVIKTEKVRTRPR